MNQKNQSIIQENQSSVSDDYLTVQEFAERAGVSNQAVYDRIKKDLKEYCIKKNGRMMISAAALEFVGNKTDSQTEEGVKILVTDDSQALDKDDQLLDKTEKQVDAQSSNQSSNQSSGQSTNQPTKQTAKRVISGINQVGDYSLIDYLIKENSRLLEEIRVKDDIIRQKDEQIAGYAAKFAGYVEQMADIARKEQEISAGALDATGRAQMLHAISEQSDSSGINQEIKLESENQVESSPKKPWWKFGKR